MQPHHHHHHLLHYYYYSINNFRPDPTRWTHIHQWSQNNPHHQIRAHTHCHYKSHRFQIYFSCNNNNSKALCFLLVLYETALEIDPNQFQDSKSLISIKIPIWVSGFLTDFLPHGSKRLLSFHTHAHTERERETGEEREKKLFLFLFFWLFFFLPFFGLWIAFSLVDRRPI